ncbi:MAG: hypothetical protein ABIH78_01240 [Candidatus Peregrinibacteria bacterium]
MSVFVVKYEEKLKQKMGSDSSKQRVEVVPVAEGVEKYKKERQGVGVEVGEGLLEPEKREETFVDAATGFRVFSVVPKDFNGNVDIYFPGDTMTIERALKTKPLLKSAEEKWSRGDKSAFVIIEGDKSSINRNKEERYSKLKPAGVFDNLMRGIESKVGKISNLHFIGHSRGGSAAQSILNEGGASDKISTVSLLDATFWNPATLIEFAKRGGRLNVAFQSGRGQEKTGENAMKIVQVLGLRQVARGHFQSRDGKVNVYDASGISHRAVAQRYVGPFMGNVESSAKDIAPAASARRTEAAADIAAGLQEGAEVSGATEKVDVPGELHGKFLDMVKNIDKSTVGKDVKKIQSLLIEDIRFNPRVLKERGDKETDQEQIANLKEETARRIRVYTNDYDNEWYTLDYARLGSDRKGLSHEMNVGLGDILLDPEIKEILVEKDGRMIKATRGVVEKGMHIGRLGFLDDETGEYVSTFTGDRFRILKSGEINISAIKKEDEARTAGKDSYKTDYLSYKYEPKEYKGPKIRQYEFKSGKYSPDYYQRIKRTDVPGEMAQKDRNLPIMKQSQVLPYYKEMVGSPPGKGWTLPRLEVFGTTVKRPNIILACMLRELEYRCKEMGMNLRFNTISTTANKPGFHGMGLAADFDAQQNWLNPLSKMSWNLPIAFVNELQKMGFKWGMYFYKTRKDGKADPMHFDLRIPLPQAIAMLTSPDAIKMAKSFDVPGKNMSLYAYASQVGGSQMYAKR